MAQVYAIPQAVNAGNNPLLNFFADVGPNANANSSQDIWRTHNQYPSSQEGKSVVLGNVMKGMLLQSNSFLINVILPVLFTDQLHFTWTKTTYDDITIPEVPHEGVSRVAEFTEEMHEGRSVRHGKSIKYELGYINTPEGQAKLGNQLTQVYNGTVRTHELTIMHGIRNCHKTVELWKLQYGIDRYNLMDRIMKDRNNFAAIAKDPTGRGIYKIVSDMKDLADSLGFEIDAVLGRNALLKYMDLNVTKLIEYSYRGPGGLAQMQNAGESATLKGLRFFNVKSYTLRNKNEKIDPLNTYNINGEVIKVAPADEFVRMMDEDNDTDQAEVTYAEAAAAFGNYWAAMDQQLKNKIIGKVGNDQGIWEYILLRPFQKYRMESLVFMKAGESTGRLHIKDEGFVKGENANLKTGYINYTYYSAAIIHAEHQILIADNVHYNACLGGAGIKFFDHNDIAQLKDKRYRFEDFNNGNKIFTKSLIPWPVPGGFKVPEAMDITGRFYGAEGDDEHYPTANEFCEYFDTEYMERPEPGVSNFYKTPLTNTVVFRGASSNKDKTRVTVNSGYHGPYTYCGVKAVRSGAHAEYRVQNYTTLL